MAGRRTVNRRNRVVEDALQDFSISAAEAITHATTAVPGPASVPQAAEVVSIETTTADRRRIYHEFLPIPTSVQANASASSESAPNQSASINVPPLTVNSIPDWSPFFREDVNFTSGDDTEPLIQEHARRYLNSVSRFDINVLCGALTTVAG